MSTPDPEKLPVMDLPSPVDHTGVGKEAPSLSGPESVVRQQGTERNPELVATAQLANSTGTLPIPQGAAVGVQPVAPVQNQAKPAVGANPTTNTPQIADDLDLIEKEWVEKAKEIVAKTKDDPKAQSEELDKVKTDYIKKRFNKDVPADRGK